MLAWAVPVFVENRLRRHLPVICPRRTGQEEVAGRALKGPEMRLETSSSRAPSAPPARRLPNVHIVDEDLEAALRFFREPQEVAA